MRFRPPSRLLVVLVVVGLAVVPALTTAATATQRPQSAAQSSELPREETVLELQLRADGDARWTVSMWFEIEDQNDSEAFDRLAREFEDGSTGTSYYETFQRSRDAVSGHVGRNMTFRNVTRTHEVVEASETNATYGVLRLSFTWTNFARVQGPILHVDDAFTTGENQTWLPGIGAGETFVIRPPDRYGVDTAPTGSRNGVLRWDGPATFEPGYLDVTYGRLATPPPVDGRGSPSVSPNSPNGTTPPPGDNQTLLLVAGLFGVGVLAVGVYLFARRNSPDAGPGSDPGPVSGHEPDASSGPAATESNGGEAVSESTAAGAAGATAAGEHPDEGDGDGEGEETAADAVDLDLLSDGERVEYLLERNGGRMKQANIVRETGWSNAKVSQLLSTMDEEGRIDKLRIGRENLISLPDEDVTEFES